jgi:2-haloacid dehalogenase
MSLHLFSPARPMVAAFDVIGTTFSLEPLRPRLVALGLPPDALETWFASGLRDAFALAATNSFEPFQTVLDGALQQVLVQHGIEAGSHERHEVLAGMKELPPHPDDEEAMRTLAQAGIRIMAVSNGAAASTRHLLEQAGLDKLVERIVSVDDVKRSKPAPEVYRYAASQAGAEAGHVMLVAAHPWDIHGAKQAGWQAGYVARGVPFPSSVMRKPDVEGETLSEVAQRLVELRP